MLFFFIQPAAPQIYTLSLHDALPISSFTAMPWPCHDVQPRLTVPWHPARRRRPREDRKSTRLNSSHSQISYAVFCLKKKNEVSQLPVSTIAHRLVEDWSPSAALCAEF